MSKESGVCDDFEKDEITGEDLTSKNFTFATPSFVSSPEKVVSFGVNSDHVFFKLNDRQNTFTFAPPTSIPQINTQLNPTIEDYDKPYKPKISRKGYDPPANLFVNAMRQSEGRDKLIDDFNQLKKHSKSRNTAKEDIANSITCTNVPKRLLTKTTAKEYFSKFGQILKITLRPRKEMVTIYYANKEAASQAYYKTGLFHGEKFNVDWTSPDMLPKSPIKKKESIKDAVRNFITADEDEVNAELEAMMGLEYNLHGSTKTQVITADAKQRMKKAKDIPRHDKPLAKIVVKSDKIEPDPQTQAVVPKASFEELQNIIRQAAHTSEDKYKILEARDKFLRLKQIKPNTLASAKVTIGTCPDMCPEKERLMREAQRQVAVYEQLPSEGKEYKINHATAVKQYSRSSADQEEPLAHELRPVESLKMTMSYLLHEIMEMCMMEGTNLAEWFHFLWDRTRGIRKDITQQELCCVDSVELVEQCARFHIVCSERLCAEEPSVFDKRINTENLTKCLQTLKYMYHDLRVKGVVCKNEAEFRGYIILLNLNDGNFMWDLQRLPADIQKSREVRFAIDVYSSIESHNFSKFFKLVKQTTYLNACILLRYFNQVRVKALSVMVKAYCRITSTSFPLYELMDILGFEDENEAVYLCEQVGLVISNDEMHIMLNRQNFSHPISSVEQGRAVNTVESKRTKQGLSVGQCIAGGKMPEKTYRNHVPHDSFDSNGYLRASAINVEDQTKQYKSKLNLAKNDPYQFIEEDNFKILQKIKTPTKIEDQTNSAAKRSGQTFLAEPSMKPAGFGDVFNKNLKTTPLFPAVFSQTSLHKEQSMFVKPSNVFHKSESDPKLTFGHKTLTFDSKQSKDLDTGDKSEPRFGTRSQNPAVVSKPNESVTQKSIVESSTTLHHATEVPKLKDSSSFAMATNKSIFSGVAQGNIFAKPAGGSSIFGNKSAAGIKTEAKSDFDRKENAKVEAELKKKKLEVQRQLEAEKLKLQELEQERRLKRIEKEAQQIIEELEDEVTKEICTSVVEKEIDKMRMYNTVSKNITKSLVNSVVLQFCEELLQEEIQVQEQLDKISERIKQRLVKKYYKSWRQNVTKKRRQREALDDTPVWLQHRSVSECARSLYHPQQDLVIQNMRRKRFKSDASPSTQDSLAPVEVIIYAGIKENLKSSDNEMIPNIFWKLVISWPELENRILLWQYRKIMNTYLCPENYTEEPIVKTYRPNPYETLNICVRHFEGIINEDNLVGTDALLFLAASSENLNTVKRRLSKTILSRSKLMPIPIAIVFLGEEDLVSENVELELDLEILLESGYVSEYTVVFEKEMSKNQILRLIQSAALWLTTNKSPLVPLEMDYLDQVLSTCLTQELWLRIQGHSNFNKHLASGLDDPALIINLHNEAVTHLTDIFLDQESLQYTSFPREFKTLLNNRISLPSSYEYFDDDWKKEESRLALEQVMNSFLLPEWNYQWPIPNISELHDAMRSYCLRALPESNCDTMTCEVISKLFLMSDDSQSPSFIDVLLEIVRKKIELLEPSLRAVYNKNHVKHFRTLPWWFKSSVLLDYISEKESYSQKESSEEFGLGEPFEKRQRLEEDLDDGLDVDSFYKPDDSLAEFCKETQRQILTVHGICRKLEDDMEKQKSKNKALNELLEKADRKSVV